MKIVACLAAMAGCAQRPLPLLSEGSQRVEEVSFMVFVPDREDVLLVIDDSPQMAPFDAKLAAAAPGLALDLLNQQWGADLHVGIVTSDLYDGGVIRGGYLVDTLRPDGMHTRNYSGSLGDALLAATSVGSSGSTTQEPLDALELAFANNPGFWRDDALHLVAFITTHDDPHVNVAPFTAGVDMVGLVAGDAPNLRAFLARFPNRSISIPFDAQTWDGAIPVPVHLISGVPDPCFDTAVESDCTVSEIDRTGNEHLLPECDGSPIRPCWQLTSGPNCGGDPELDVKRTDFPPAGTRVIAQCVAAE